MLCSRWENFVRVDLFVFAVDPQFLNQSAVVRALMKGVIRLLWLPAVIVRTLNPKKCNFNAPAIRKNFFSKFDKYNIVAL